MDAFDRFETQRLSAERLRATDYADLCRMNQNASVMETIGGLRSDETTREYLRKNLEHWDRYGFGLWILRRKVDGMFVGRSALRRVDVDGSDETEIGYALMPEYRGASNRNFARHAADRLWAVGYYRGIRPSVPEQRCVAPRGGEAWW